MLLYNHTNQSSIFGIQEENTHSSNDCSTWISSFADTYRQSPVTFVLKSVLGLDVG